MYLFIVLVMGILTVLFGGTYLGTFIYSKIRDRRMQAIANEETAAFIPEPTRTGYFDSVRAEHVAGGTATVEISTFTNPTTGETSERSGHIKPIPNPNALPMPSNGVISNVALATARIGADKIEERVRELAKELGPIGSGAEPFSLRDIVSGPRQEGVCVVCTKSGIHMHTVEELRNALDREYRKRLNAILDVVKLDLLDMDTLRLLHSSVNDEVEKRMMDDEAFFQAVTKSEATRVTAKKAKIYHPVAPKKKKTRYK